MCILKNDPHTNMKQMIKIFISSFFNVISSDHFYTVLKRVSEWKNITRIRLSIIINVLIIYLNKTWNKI